MLLKNEKYIGVNLRWTLILKIVFVLIIVPKKDKGEIKIIIN
jgi:hypothetical protein